MSTLPRFLGLFVAASLLLGCSSTTVKPYAIEQYDKAMSRGSERFQAGDLLLAREQFMQAMRAAELDDAGPRRAQALLSIGAVNTLLEDDLQAGTAYREALKESTRFNDPRGAAIAQLGLAHFALRQGQAEAALSAYQEALKTPGVLDPAERAQAENGLALALVANRQSAEGLRLLRQLEQSARASASPLLATTLSNLASVLLKEQQTDPALKLALEALALDRATHHPPSIAASHLRLAEIYARQQDWGAARDAAERAERIFRYTGQKAALGRLQAMRQGWP